MLTGLSTLVVVILAFLAGLLAFRIKSHWCRTCGAALSCTECRDRIRKTRPATGDQT